MQKPKSDAECRTLTEAYNRLRVSVTNLRRMWSGQSSDGNVVITLWSNLFADEGRRVYDVLNRPTGNWVNRPENRRRIEHLKYAQAKRGGIFDSIIVTQADNSYTKIIRREIGPRMRLVSLDEAGRFRAERVGGG